MSNNIGIKINATFSVNQATYDASMALKPEGPTPDEPFIFRITSTPDAQEANDTSTTTLLTVAVGGSEKIYVAVAPPKELLDTAKKDLVKALNVIVSEGVYDENTGKFTT